MAPTLPAMIMFGIESTLLLAFFVIILLLPTILVLHVIDDLAFKTDGELTERRKFLRTATIWSGGLVGGIMVASPFAWSVGYTRGERSEREHWQERLDELRERNPSMMTAPKTLEYEYEGEIENGDYAEYTLRLDSMTQIVYSMRSRHDISVLFMDGEAFDSYKDDGSGNYKAFASSRDTTEADVSYQMSPGTYHCVLDNKRREHTDGPQDTEVKFAIRGYSH